jgi:hypothetical protein
LQIVDFGAALAKGQSSSFVAQLASRFVGAMKRHHALLPETAGVMASQGMMALQRHSSEVVSTPLYPRCARVRDMLDILDNASPLLLADW